MLAHAWCTDGYPFAGGPVRGLVLIGIPSLVLSRDSRLRSFWMWAGWEAWPGHWERNVGAMAERIAAGVVLYLMAFVAAWAATIVF